MQQTNATYREIYESGDYVSDVRVVIDGITYEQNKIYSMVTRKKLFKDKKPKLGCAIAGEIEISLDDPARMFSRMASIKPYFRIKNATKVSPWYQKGQFYINTRDIDQDTGRVEIHGYDILRNAEKTYPSSVLAWDATHPDAYSVVKEIMAHLNGVSYNTVNNNPSAYIEQDTISKLTAIARLVNFPAQYSMREVLESIAAMYGGNFVMSDTGKLSLVGFVSVREDTFYLVTETGIRITFGGTRILLRS